jgi:daunorubicin resistance ABC transporter ATP-binding subunit
MDQNFTAVPAPSHASGALVAQGSSAAARDLVVQTRRLTKRFGEFVAVDSLDLDVERGTVVSLLGPNGAGKTTTVRMLATLLRPNEGSATVAGYDVVHDADSVRREISLTGQFAALDKNLTSRENLILMARLRGRERGAARNVADELIERFDIDEFRDRLVKNLSGGQRRRVDLAASLIDQPTVLVLDEPTTGLDPRSRQVVWSTIRELIASGVTLLLTTQYLEEADAVSDRVVLIDHGREVAAGTPAELKARVGELRVDVVAADSAALTQLRERLAGSFELRVSEGQRTLAIPAPGGSGDLARVAAAVQESGIAVDEIALRRPTLDDAFLALTGHHVEPDPGAAQADQADRDSHAAQADQVDRDSHAAQDDQADRDPERQEAGR